MIKKTLSKFHPENVGMNQQYWENGYTRYSKLMQVLLVAKQKNQLMTLNHHAHSTGSARFRSKCCIIHMIIGEVEDVDHYHGRERGRGRRFCPYEERNIRTSTKMKKPGGLKKNKKGLLHAQKRDLRGHGLVGYTLGGGEPLRFAQIGEKRGNI